MSSAGRLFCGGWAVWDVRLRVETFPPVSARTRVVERREDVGGPAAVAALAAASLGTPAALVAHTGGDAPGERVRRRLKDLGGVVVLEPTPGFATPINTILVAPDGERFIFREAPPEPAVPPTLPRLSAADVLLLDCRAPQLALALARQAHEVGAQVVLDFDRDESVSWALAQLSSHVIADEALTEQLGGFGELRARLPGAAVLAATLGPAGVMTDQGRIPAYPVEVLDSTGAGDVFHGAYAAALLQDHAQPFHYAAAAAAHRCQTGDLPTPAAVRALMGAADKAAHSPDAQ